MSLLEILNIYNIRLIKIPEEEYLRSKTLAVNILTLSPFNTLPVDVNTETIVLEKTKLFFACKKTKKRDKNMKNNSFTSIKPYFLPTPMCAF